jgi:RimJ/RimL family protein N-acetyltransferase
MYLRQIIEARTARPQLFVKTPQACTSAELRACVDLIASGGEVQTYGLAARVQQAALLSFLRYHGAVVGVAALKHPDEGYRDSVFDKAGVEHSEQFRLELGWLFVAPAFRGQGYSEHLIRAVLQHANGPVFATSAANNVAVQRINQHVGLRPTGRPYTGHNGRWLVLFTMNDKPL